MTLVFTHEPCAHEETLIIFQGIIVWRGVFMKKNIIRTPSRLAEGVVAKHDLTPIRGIR